MATRLDPSDKPTKKSPSTWTRSVYYYGPKIKKRKRSLFYHRKSHSWAATRLCKAHFFQHIRFSYRTDNLALIDQQLLRQYKMWWPTKCPALTHPPTVSRFTRWNGPICAKTWMHNGVPFPITPSHWRDTWPVEWLVACHQIVQSVSISTALNGCLIHSILNVCLLKINNVWPILMF